MTQATFTLFTGSKNTVAKGYDVVDGTLTKIKADNFYDGTFETVGVGTEGLLDRIKSIKQGQFITAGVHQTLDAGNCPADACRTIKDFPLPSGIGLLIIDGDSLPDFGITSTEDCVKKLRSLDSAMKTALIVTSPSASSGIKFNGVDSGLRGLHSFMIVDDAEAIPSILETLHKRSVLAGYARSQITANGKVLIKSIVDLAMKSSNQPCYEGGARLLNNTISQKRKILKHGSGVLVAAGFTPLTAIEEAEFKKVCAKLKSTVQAEADVIRATWRSKQMVGLVAKGLSPEKAKLLLDKAFDGGNLSGEIEISTDKFGIVTVEDILADPTKYHEATCADPMDPDYGQSKAKIYSLQDKPCIHSMAHGGGTTYYLHEKQLTRVELADMIDATDDFDELTQYIVKRVANSDLRDAERDVLLKAISKKSKASISSLRSDLKSILNTKSSNEIDHARLAENVIEYIGKDNLLNSSGFLYKWNDDGVWAEADEREIKKVTHELANSCKLTSFVVNSVLDMIKTEVNASDHKFDLNPNSINCLNGELEFINGNWVLGSHVREHYRTAMIPIAYDPNATAPRFSQFLEEVFSGDADAKNKIRIVLEALGYTLIPSCHLEKFFLLIGAGANGKSVLLGVLAELIGRQYVCAVQPSQFENRFQRGHLQGKLANIITEIAVGAEIADAQLKSLVSGEMTTAEHKHKNPFDFNPYAKHWFGTNHLPHTRDFSDATFRRTIILTFNNKFNGANRDVHLAKKLKSELPGIFNMALEGLRQLNINHAFTTCASGIEVIDKWKLEADQAAQFVAEECVVGPTHNVKSADLYAAYRLWAEDAGIRYTLNHNNFSNRLASLGYPQGRTTNGIRMINGLAIKKPFVNQNVNAVSKAQLKIV